MMSLLTWIMSLKGWSFSEKLLLSSIVLLSTLTAVLMYYVWKALM